MDKNRINKRFKLQKRRKKRYTLLYIFVLMMIIFLYFIVLNKPYVYENNWSIANLSNSWSKNKVNIIKKEKIISYEKFELIFTWTVVDRSWLEYDFDLKNIDLTGSILEIEFSTNNEFKSYPILSAANLEKIRYWYMLWRLRNRNKVFWVWKNTDSVNKNKYNLIEIEEDWKIEFKAANLSWWILFVKIIINWKKIKINN